MSKLCANCGSQKHIECCAQCGRVVPPSRRRTGFCTARCANLQAAADRLSAQQEENDLNMENADE